MKNHNIVNMRTRVFPVKVKEAIMRLRIR
uniref:Uncharacterized protein n=1 Tax=Anguilla anguilla TaxID=7936 RepID=A0A0E9QWT7_ANGAN